VAPRDATSFELTREELMNWCKPRMATYKIPRKFFVLSVIPRNAMGKVNKKEIAKLFEENK
jgi:malonyl-CoA/methylmalonyl-CoA synthetase